MQVETVKIVSPVSEGNPHGYVVINKADLSAEHVLFDDKPVNKEKPAKKDAE